MRVFILFFRRRREGCAAAAGRWRWPRLRWPRLPFPSSTKNGVKGGEGVHTASDTFLVLFTCIFVRMCVRGVACLSRFHVSRRQTLSWRYKYVLACTQFPTAGGRAISLGVGGATPAPPSPFGFSPFCCATGEGETCRAHCRRWCTRLIFWVWLLFREYKNVRGVTWRGVGVRFSCREEKGKRAFWFFVWGGCA